MTNSCWTLFDKELVQFEGVTQYLSFYDLNRLPKFTQALINKDLQTFEKVLYDNGLDISLGYNVTKSLHRPRTSNSVYEGFRVDARERLDKEWIATGCASEDAVCASLGDLGAEMKAMNPWNSGRSVGEWMMDGDDCEEGL